MILYSRPATVRVPSLATPRLRLRLPTATQRTLPLHPTRTKTTMSTVDTSPKGQPTGPAALFAFAHSNPHPLKLYGAWFCPFVQRSWIVLAEKRIPHQYVEINPYHKAPEFLALNPRGLVPTLAVPIEGDKEQKPLYESTVVCEYLDEAFADEEKYGGRLLPQGDGNVYERARCRLWMDHVGSRVVPSFYRFLQHTEGKGYSIEEVRGEFLGHLKAFVREMADASEGPWFLGERFSLVDVMLAPWAKRLFLIDYYKKGGVGIPAEGDGAEDEEIWKRWRVWRDAVNERESVRKTWSEDDKYVDVYKRYAEDTTESEVGKATRQGKSLP